MSGWVKIFSKAGFLNTCSRQLPSEEGESLHVHHQRSIPSRRRAQVSN